MKVKIVGNALCIESSYTVEDIKFLENYSRDDLCLFEAQPNGTNKKVFEMGVCPCCEEPYVEQNAVIFNSQTSDGHAVLTIMLPKADDLKGYVADVYGDVITNIKDVEYGMDERLAAAKSRRKAILDEIEVG